MANRMWILGVLCGLTTELTTVSLDNKSQWFKWTFKYQIDKFAYAFSTQSHAPFLHTLSSMCKSQSGTIRRNLGPSTFTFVIPVDCNDRLYNWLFSKQHDTRCTKCAYCWSMQCTLIDLRVQEFYWATKQILLQNDLYNKVTSQGRRWTVWTQLRKFYGWV